MLKVRSSQGICSQICALTTVFTGFLLTPQVFAQAVDPTTIATSIPGFLEGPTERRQGIGANTDIPGFRNVTVNGVPTIVGRNRIYTSPVISSPTVDGLSWADIAGARLPGRSQRGFLGGTCLCETVVLDAGNGNGVPDYNQVMVSMTLEPAENVLLGRLTESNCTTQACDTDGSGAEGLKVNGVPMDFIIDPRLTSPPASNRGFELDMIRSQTEDPGWLGSPVAAEGYRGRALAPFTVPHLHLYDIDIDGGVLLNEGVTEVSAVRFQGRQRDGGCEYDGRGFTHDPQTGLVSVARTDNGAPLFTVNAVAEVDDLTNTFGIWDDGVNVGGDCAEEVDVTFNGVTVTVPVDIRIDVDED